MSKQARILLLCDDRRGHANTVLDHINAFRRFSRHDLRTFNPKAMRDSVALDLDDFDVVVVHYSVILSDPIYLSPRLLDKLRRFRGLKVQFIQDEYRWVDRATAAARDVGIGVLFTVAPDPAARQLYDARLPGVRRVQTLTGYVPETLLGRRLKPLSERNVDVGYRARDLPFWYGALARDKALIGQRFLELAPPYGLRCDIAWREENRIYGGRWVDFIASCRATLGCESGASIADFDGGAERAVRGFLRAHPGATYEDVHEAVLRPYEGNVTVNVVSPRVFESAALGTAMIMFPGQYSGVVSAGEHYIALEKDFSNISDVVERLRDDAFIEQLTHRTYDELIRSGRWSYQTFVAEFDRVMDEEARTMRGPGRLPRWRIARAERELKVPGMRVRFFRLAHSAVSRMLRRDPSMHFSIEYESQVEKAFFAARILFAEADLRALLKAARRRGAPLDRSLREIMELSLLRKAITGRSNAEPAFKLDVEFDAGRCSISFVSVPASESRATPSLLATDGARQVLRAGQLNIIEWDHRALGGKLKLSRRHMVVGVGYEGLESFAVLAEIGRSEPELLERALAPMLKAVEPVLSPVGSPIR